jgi:YaiO family outer membrane protein
MLLIREGRQSDGFDLLRPYADLASDYYDGLFDVGNAYAAADRMDDARAYFERAVELTPERPEARMGLARLASREGRLTDSLARYRTIVDENPEALEAVLGVIRIARLQNDGATARRALELGRRHAPNSIELLREELALALEAGDISVFLEVLERFEQSHPGHPLAGLWRLRWTAMETGTVDFTRSSRMLDPWLPEITGGVLYLHAFTQVFDEVQPLKEWQADGDFPDRAGLFRTLAREMALRLRRDVVEKFLGIARELDEEAGNRPARDQWPAMLAAGWWAQVATPFAWADELSPDFDPQAIHLWLAAEVQRRLRTLAVETESPLEEEWLLRRAVWYNAWTDKWDTPEAANSLYLYLASMIPGAFDGITRERLQDAWRESERWLAPAETTFAQSIAQARWRQGRHDFTGALERYRRLALDYPAASEPAQREAVLLRGLGRNREALASLRRLNSGPHPSPAARLETAALLVRFGEFQAAQRQLDLAAETGFDEPLLHLRRAQLAEALGLDQQAADWIDRGLAQHPRSDSLLSWRAGWLLERREFEALARLLRDHPNAPWLTPDLVAAAKPHLTVAEIEAITTSTVWWFQWHWLPWHRLEAQSIAALREAAREATGLGQRERALDILRPATAARIPDAELWLAAGRMFDVTGEWEEAERAYRFAHTLGLGRPDAEVVMLARRGRRADPLAVAREFASRLNENPDDFGLRSGFVVAALRAGEITAAERALEPLVAIDPDNPAVRDLAAQVKGAKGNVRQARSLYASILRGDPTDTDRRDALRNLRSANQWGFAGGYEFSDLRGLDGNPDPANWQEAFAGVFWRQPVRQSWALEYRWFERADTDASQVRLDYGIGLDQDWIVRAHAAPAAEGDIIPRLKLGGGASYRVLDPFFATFDFEWLTFSDLDVYQFAPGLSWRWHPRSIIDTRVYLNNNVLESGTSEWTTTWVLNASWEFAPQSSARLSFAVGDESVANPIRDLIGNDNIVSVGLSANLGLGRKWSLIPAWRYERHDRFDLNAFGLSAVYSY